MSYKPSYQEEVANALITRNLVVNGSVSQSGQDTVGSLRVTNASVPTVLNTRYVRTAGSNANDGLTPATAWATLAFAVTQIPTIFANAAYVIDITGIIEVLPLRFQIPEYIANVGLTFNPNGIDFVTAPLGIHADLTLLTTIPPANILSVTIDPVTLHRIVLTNLVFAPNVFDGKIIGIPVPGVTKQGVSLDNTVDTIFVNSLISPASIAANGLTISDYGATLTTSPASTTPTITIQDALSGFSIEGVRILAPQTNLSSSISFSQVFDNCIVNCCEVECFSMDNTPAGILFSKVWLHVSTSGRTASRYSNRFTFLQSAAQGVSIEPSFALSRHPGMHSCFLQLGAFKNCSPLCRSSNVPNLLVMSTNISQSLVTGGVSGGIALNGGGVALLQNVRINGSTFGSAVSADGLIRIVAFTLAGTLNGFFGVELIDGAHFRGDAATTVTGTLGDVKIGTLPATTWVAVGLSPNTRISDTGANGDCSTAKHP